MRQKPLVERKLENLKIGLIGLENMISRGSNREDFLQQIENLKERVRETAVLISNESEDFQ